MTCTEHESCTTLCVVSLVSKLKGLDHHWAKSLDKGQDQNGSEEADEFGDDNKATRALFASIF